MSDAAVQAFARLAVGTAQAYERLRAESVVTRQSGSGKHTDKHIIFRRKRLKQICRPLTQVGMPHGAAIGMHYRCYDIDQQKVDRRTA